jgi:hypothetical protein
MKIFSKDGPQQPTKLQKRVEKIGTTDLVLWSENALFAIGKNLTQWTRSHDDALLEEAHLGAEALLAITAELKKRNHG